MAFHNMNLMSNIPESDENYYRKVGKKITLLRANLMILDQRAQDIAEINGSTVSDVYETAITEGLLPEDPHARQAVSKVLFGKTPSDQAGEWEKYEIQDALADDFGMLAASETKEPRYKNARPLVDFCHSIMRRRNYTWSQKSRSGYPSELHELASRFRSFCEVMEHAADNGASKLVAIEAKSLRERFCPMIEEARVTPLKIVDAVITNWEYVGNSVVTFQVLEGLMRACHRKPAGDTAFDRAEYQNVCERVMPEWTRRDEEEMLRAAKRRAESRLGEFPIADGDAVIAPNDWLVANPEAAESAHFAGVIEIKNGELYGAPHFIIFTEDEPVQELGDEVKAELVARATAIWPRMKDVRADAVELKYASNGGVLNQAEFDAAPRIGVFPLYDEGSHPAGNPPFGAVVRRKNEGAGKGAGDKSAP